MAKVKSATELLSKYKAGKKGNSKRSVTVSLDSDLFERLTYLATETGLTKNEIMVNSLISFGLEDIEIKQVKKD